MLWPMTVFCFGKVECWRQKLDICTFTLLTHEKDGTGEEKIVPSWYLIHLPPACADAFFSSPPPPRPASVPAFLSPVFLLQFRWL